MVLAVDLETYSSVDLAKCGVFRYTQAEDFEILLFGYAFDDNEVQVIDLARGEDIPKEIMEALTDPNILKHAFNAAFERTCLAKHFGTPMPPEQWRCSQAHALTLGLPSSLKNVAEVLKLENQKMDEGRALIRYFCNPCKPTKANGGRTRNLPHHDPAKWHLFKTYCKQDVVVERDIRKKLDRYPMQELKLWFLDQKINDYGIRIDTKLVKNAIECDKMHQEKLMKEAIHLTGLENPNSPAQLKTWLEDKHGIKADSLAKAKVEELLNETDNPEVKRVLELRQEMSRTSVRKYEAMDRAVCKDSRARGLLQYHGALTGRWSGRLIQTQNLPRNNMSDLDIARRLLRDGKYETLELLFESVPDVLSQLIRTAIIPSPGHRFIVSDFSSIEARILAWIAGEQWMVDVFSDHGKIYEMTASRMFNVPLELIVRGNPEYELRQKGKVAVLACGYSGSVGALKAMGALNMGLSEDELLPIVNSWRQSNPNIVDFWWDVEKAAKKVIQDRTSVNMQYGLKFYYESGAMFIGLPSGRRLAYVNPRIEWDERFNKDGITYEGINLGKWCRIRTFGGKLVENIVQAIARDCLAESLLRLDAAGYKIATHIHDEVVLDVPKGFGSLKEVEEVMSEPIDWAPGLPMGADGFESDYYRKD